MRRALLLITLGACANLPELERGVCGNAIIEIGENCDGVSEYPGSRCLDPGEEGACHYTCATEAGGTTPSCPSGWACDADRLCRKPTGGFDLTGRFAAGGAETLAAADFDGDRRVDLVSRNAADLAGRATISFHYFDERAALAETRPFAKLMMAPALGDVSKDGLADLVFSDFRVGVMLGRKDRVWVPEAFTPYVLPAGFARVTGVHEGYVSSASALASFATLADGPGVYTPDVARQETALRAPIGVPLDTLLGEPLAADIVQGPDSRCDELVLAFRDQTSFSMLELCEPEQPDGTILWRTPATVNTIALDPPAPLDAAPLAADLNADSYLDVLLGAGGTTYAAFGDGTRLNTAVPYVPHHKEANVPLEGFAMPLAAGDLSGDGVVDFVLPDRIVLSTLPSLGMYPVYADAFGNGGGRWTSAKIVDLNGNGFLDAVAAQRGRLHVDFFNGSGRPWVLASKVLSARPVSQLASGDLDGDLVEDLVMVEQAASTQELDTVKVAFGALGQSPGVPQAVARARNVKQVGTFREASTETIIVVSDHPSPGNDSNLTYLLGGNAERIPFAALDLLRFSQDGSLGSFVSTQLVVGSFAAPASKDALTLAVEPAVGQWQFWMMPAVDSPLPTPLSVAGALDARLQPAERVGMPISFPAARVYAVGAAADLDRDGRDESVWVMPADNGARCGIETFAVTGQQQAFSLVSRGVVLLEARCMDPQVATADIDEDGFLDALVLTGAKNDADRKLFVLWNDAGAFAAERASAIQGADSPQAFTTIARAGDLPFSVVYATKQAVVQWRYAGARSFGAPFVLTTNMPLTNGTGIAAADLDGDGVTDLAVADDGDVRVLKARVE